jgi:hypothetical protein
MTVVPSADDHQQCDDIIFVARKVDPVAVAHFYNESVRRSAQEITP